MTHGYLLGIAESLPVRLRTPLMVTGTTGVVMAVCLFWPVVAEAGPQCGAGLAHAGLDGAGRYAQWAAVSAWVRSVR
jgi:hypothetical protein